MSNRAFAITWLIAAAGAFNLWRIDTLAAAPPQPEQTIQIKLRDLLELVPKGATPEQAAEIVTRLRGIEARLAAIEALLKGAGPK